MFSGFSQSTQDFLWNLTFNNERPWFNAHKDEFLTHLKYPMDELSRATLAMMGERFPEEAFFMHVSRIYRDARRLFGRGPYKDHLWFTLRRPVGEEAPSFWFEIGPASWVYGMGFFYLPAARLEKYRAAIDANPAAFRSLVAPIDEKAFFENEGKSYARSKGDPGHGLEGWYNRRQIILSRSENFGGDLFSPELPKLLCDGFEELMPLYKWLYDHCGE